MQRSHRLDRGRCALLLATTLGACGDLGLVTSGGAATPASAAPAPPVAITTADGGPPLAAPSAPAPSAPAPKAPAAPSKVQAVLQLIAQHDVYGNGDPARNRGLLRGPLQALSIAESKALMDAVRQQGKVAALVAALIDVRSSAVNPAALRSAWNAILGGGGLDHAVEILTYASFHSDQGTYCRGTEVHIADYGTSTGVLIHESHHAFNDVHGLAGVNGLNEGTSITVIKLHEGGWKNLAETVFGTVLYYRDIGLTGYPKDIPFGDGSAYDAKGRDYLQLLMRNDESRIDWLDAQQVRTLFDLFWKPLDRNVPWAQWEQAAREATRKGIDWLARQR